MCWRNQDKNLLYTSANVFCWSMNDCVNPVHLMQYSLSSGKWTGRTKWWNTDSTRPLSVFNSSAENSDSWQKKTTTTITIAKKCSIADDETKCTHTNAKCQMPHINTQTLSIFYLWFRHHFCVIRTHPSSWSGNSHKSNTDKAFSCVLIPTVNPLIRLNWILFFDWVNSTTTILESSWHIWRANWISMKLQRDCWTGKHILPIRWSSQSSLLSVLTCTMTHDKRIADSTKKYCAHLFISMPIVWASHYVVSGFDFVLCHFRGVSYQNEHSKSCTFMFVTSNNICINTNCKWKLRLKKEHCLFEADVSKSLMIRIEFLERNDRNKKPFSVNILTELLFVIRAFSSGCWSNHFILHFALHDLIDVVFEKHIKCDQLAVEYRRRWVL